MMLISSAIPNTAFCHAKTTSQPFPYNIKGQILSASSRLRQPRRESLLTSVLLHFTALRTHLFASAFSDAASPTKKQHRLSLTRFRDLLNHECRNCIRIFSILSSKIFIIFSANSITIITSSLLISALASYLALPLISSA